MTIPLLAPSHPEIESGELCLRTGAWYGEQSIRIAIPASWHTQVFAPRWSSFLSDVEIAERLESPSGQAPLHELARGKRRPVIVVDDLNRPTPAGRLIPHLLRQLVEGGIDAGSVEIVLAAGTHGPSPTSALAGKIGEEAVASCRVSFHDCRGDTVPLGRTSFGTPVHVNRIVSGSDLVIGVGGLYPNHTAGFGGGSKLALGVLDIRSIAALHGSHRSVGWGSPDIHNSFRRDLDEIADRIGMSNVVTVVVDGHREIVDLRCGEPSAYYEAFVSQMREGLRAPRPDAEADIVVANAYPGDTSLTFVRIKGMVPLELAPPGASRIVIASCGEGLGFHGLEPFLNAPAGHSKNMARLSAETLARHPGLLVNKIVSRARQIVHRRQGPSVARRGPVWVYRPETPGAPALPVEIPGMRVTSSWTEIVDGVAREQGARERLNALVYDAAPLLWVS